MIQLMVCSGCLLFSHGKLASESQLGTRHHTRVATGHRILDIEAGGGKEMTADVNLYLSFLLTLKTMNNNESIADLTFRKGLMINNAKQLRPILCAQFAMM